MLFLAQGIWQELSVIRGICSMEGLLPFGSQQPSTDFRICRAHPTGHFYRPCPDPAGPVTPQILSWPHEAARLPHKAPGPASQSVRWPRGTDTFVEKAGHSSLLPLLECYAAFLTVVSLDSVLFNNPLLSSDAGNLSGHTIVSSQVRK